MNCMTESFIDDRILLDWRARHPIDFEAEDRRVDSRRKRRQRQEDKQPTEESVEVIQDEAAVESRDTPSLTARLSSKNKSSSRSALAMSEHNDVIVEVVEASSSVAKSRNKNRRSAVPSHAVPDHDHSFVKIIDIDVAADHYSSGRKRYEKDIRVYETVSDSSRRSKHSQSAQRHSTVHARAKEHVASMKPELDQATKYRHGRSNRSYDREETADLLHWLHCLESQPRAGTGWISPHPLSAVEHGSEPPQSHVSIETHEQGRRRLTYQEWLDYQSHIQQHEQADLHAVWAEEDRQQNLRSASRSVRESTTGYLSSLQPLDARPHGRLIRLVMPWDRPADTDTDFR